MKPSEALQKALADHGAVSEFVRNLNQTVTIWNEKDDTAKAGQIRFFLKTHVIDHFALEEQSIFPQLLTACADADLPRHVAALQHDHSQLLLEVSKLNELLGQVERVGGSHTMAQLEMEFRLFLGKLQRHAAEEDKMFASLAAKTRQEP